MNILRYPLSKHHVTCEFQSPKALEMLHCPDLPPLKKRHCGPVLVEPKHDWAIEPTIHPKNHWFEPTGTYYILYRELVPFVDELHKFFKGCAAVIPSCDDPFSWHIVSNNNCKGDCGYAANISCEERCYEATVTVFRSPVPLYRKDQEILVVEIRCISSQDRSKFYDTRDQFLAKLQGKKHAPLAPDYDVGWDLSELPPLPLPPMPAVLPKR